MGKGLLFYYRLIIAHEADNFAEDDKFVADDGVHVVVLRLETEVVLLLVEGFDRSLVVYESDNHFAVLGFGSLLDDDDVAFENAGICHGFAFDAESEELLVRGDGTAEGDVGFNLLSGEDGGSGSHCSEKRNFMVVLGLVLDVQSD